MLDYRLKRMAAALGAFAALWLPVALAQQPRAKAPAKPPVHHVKPGKRPQIKPVIPSANRHQPDKVFLEHADNLILDELQSPDYQILRGNVEFRRGDMIMRCDSAHFYEATSSLDAFSNVSMQQGDTLFVYGDELSYDGITEMARLFANMGKQCRLINRDVELRTDQFDYDLQNNVGYYQFGGTLTDRTNRLTSVEGYYYPATKNAFFYEDVVLTGPRKAQNDTIRMYTDSLQYNTASKVATLLARTHIINKDGEIFSSNGTYNTGSGQADLLNRSTVVTKRGTTLTGDTLFYDRNKGYGEARGDMVLVDSARQASLLGDYGFYNEVTDSAFVTGRALAMEYSQKDTLYTHGDTIIAVQLPDSTHRTTSFHNVRFFRRDIQGLCDSMVFLEADSTLYMYRHPIVWNDTKQIFGNEIRVHLTDSTADKVFLPRFGMAIDHIAEDCYDQLSGSSMTAWLNDSTLQRLYVEGNVQMIMFPMENDSSYNKFTFVESSYLDANFGPGGQIEHVVLWPETSGTVTPLYLAKRSSYFLPNFQWYDQLRPLSPDEVFDVPEQMKLLMGMPDVGGKRRGG